ncbi:MAG TPA: competence type IV pilus ATPase ComGA [Pseudogracilibacillus sp.]|nr:competence type IV pilus ATPase ComGA [Pseudogracilibacillus sp.]
MNDTTSIANQFLEKACKKGASDIHFHPNPETNKVQVYFRLLGKRVFVKNIQRRMFEVILTYFKYRSNMDIGETRRPQNGILSYETDAGELYSLRLSTLPLLANESLTIRLLPQSNLQVNRLFLFPQQFLRMKKWLQQEAGIIFFTGPTGCGKSTTMYALLEAILREQSFQAITLEDPIERTLEDVIQVEINERRGVTYEAGLKAALRHDPDIIMIGEIRDEATAQFAFQASLTGHLVLSTIHAKNAKGTIDRLLDLNVTRGDLAQSVIAIASIQLLPILHGEQEERAAIVEMLDGPHLENIILNENDSETNQFQTFHQLKEKAYIYGFISKKTYQSRSIK